MVSFRQFIKRRVVSPELDQSINNIPKSMGSFGHDPWGYSAETLKIGMGAFRGFYEKYFRVDAYGLDNIPSQGRVLIIPNHSGQIPLDGLLIGYAMATNQHGPRVARAMIERWVSTLPFAGNILNELGAVIGDPVNCVKMLRKEEAVIVFPEGVRGSGKIFKERYQLKHFGTGFMHIAMTENTPIVPVGVVGCEETLPSAVNLKRIARLVGIPYLPVTPPFPLPVKVKLYFGKPMSFEKAEVDEHHLRQNVSQVKDAIRDLIDLGLHERKSWFT